MRQSCATIIRTHAMKLSSTITKTNSVLKTTLCSCMYPEYWCVVKWLCVSISRRPLFEPCVIVSRMVVLYSC